MPEEQIDPVLDDESETKPTPRRRSKKAASRKKHPHDMFVHGDGEPVDDPDTWLKNKNWEWPLMRSKLIRDSPEFSGKTSIKGVLDEREGAPWLTSEIKATFGGGKYRVYVIGPRTAEDAENGHVEALGYKVIQISGPPKVSQALLPIDATGQPTTSQEAAAAYERDTLANLSAQAQSGIVGILGDVVKDKMGSSRNGNGSNYHEGAVRAIQGSADAQVNAIREAAQQQAALLNNRVEEQRKQLDEERRERERERKTMEEQIRQAASSGSELVSSLVPVLTQSSSQQIDSIMRSADAQIARVQDQAKADIAAARQSADAQVANMKTLYESQLTLLQATHERQIGMLEQRLQSAESRAETLEKEVQLSRSAILDIYRAKDPMESLERHAHMMAMIKEINGDMGGGDENSGLGEDAPDWMKMLNNLSSSLSPAVNAIASRVVGQPAQQPMMDPQAMAAMQQQQQQHAMQQYAMQQAQQAQLTQGATSVAVQPMPGQTQPAAPQQPLAEPVKPIPPETIKHILALVNDAHGNSVAVEQAVTAAMTHLDRSVLRSLCSKQPEAIVTAFEKHGLLPPGLQTDEGRKYVADILTAIKPRL